MLPIAEALALLLDLRSEFPHLSRAGLLPEVAAIFGEAPEVVELALQLERDPLALIATRRGRAA
jgi:hypothetical protein